MQFDIRQATPRDAKTVADVLGEAAAWLDGRAMPLWQGDELSAATVTSDVAAGEFFLAEVDGARAGVVKFQLEDPIFWPDVPTGESAFIHRVAVRRRFAGRGASTAILAWAAQRTAELGREYLRLDCDARRPKLRAVYERFGFRHHSDRQVGPYFVARYEYQVRAVH